MKYARIVDDKAVDVRTESPEGCFVADIASQFVAVPDSVQNGWTFIDKEWSAPESAKIEIIPEAPKKAPILSPIQFKLCFTATERIEIKKAKATDEVIADYYDILDDLRLKEVDLNLQSNKDGIAYLVSKSLLTVERAAEILQGVIK